MSGSSLRVGHGRHEQAGSCMACLLRLQCSIRWGHAVEGVQRLSPPRAPARAAAAAGAHPTAKRIARSACSFSCVSLQSTLIDSARCRACLRAPEARSPSLPRLTQTWPATALARPQPEAAGIQDSHPVRDNIHIETLHGGPGLKKGEASCQLCHGPDARSLAPVGPSPNLSGYSLPRSFYAAPLRPGSLPGFRTRLSTDPLTVPAGAPQQASAVRA